MKNRITLVACFDKNSNSKILETTHKVCSTACKVPYNIENRLENDTLPFHLTLSAWNIKYKDEIINKLQNLNFNPIKANFKFSVMPSTVKGKILYLKPISNIDKLANIQRATYSFMPNEKYSPDIFDLHVTINIDENIKLIESQYNQLKDISLELVLDKICLFEIYPANLVYSM